MSPLLLVGLLGLLVTLPVFSGDDEAEADTPPAPEPEPDTTPDTTSDPDPVTPETPPNQPDGVTEANGTITGTQGDDRLFASAQSPAVSGGAGDDTLSSFIDGVEAQLSGGAGDDVLETNALVGFPDQTDGTQILTGGTGADTFIINLDVTRLSGDGVDFPLVSVTDFVPGVDQLELRVGAFPSAALQFADVTQQIGEDGTFTDLNVRYTDATGAADDLVATVRIEGLAGLDESAFTIDDGRNLIEGTEGDDTLRSTDQRLGRTGPDTLSGGAGDDLLVLEPTDDAGAVVLDGGAGNDTLLASEVEFSNPTTLVGGAGDDVLIAELFQPASSATVDTFTTGDGADTVTISSIFNNLEGDNDFGFVARVTDFTPGEDMIVINTSAIQNTPDATFDQSVTVTEDAPNNQTNLRYTVTNIQDGRTLSGLIRLEGLTGLTEDDIVLTLSPLGANLTDGGVVSGTAGDDVITTG